MMNNTEEKILEHIVRRMQTDKAIDAPTDAVQYAKHLYRTRSAEPNATLIQRVLAILSIDLAPNRAAFGERSTGEGQARQMLFEADDNAVNLRIKATGRHFEIRGQILGDGFEHGAIQIANSLKTIAAEIDETGEFNLSDVPVGEYNIAICGHKKEIVIEKINIK